MSPRDINEKIKKIENKIEKNRIRNKRSEDRDAFQRVFDSRTVMYLSKMLTNGIIGELVGIISQGKEANVYFAYDTDNNPIAIKIYKIDIQSAKWMKNYIIGDPRFKKIGTSPDKIIFTWCKKEYKNLDRIYKRKMLCPKPILSKGNILLMSYIGEQDGTPAAKLKDSVDLFENPMKEMQITLTLLERLYKDAKLVHGDLSEYNILYHKNQQILIDVSQAVSIQHPKALYFLSRDIKNVLNFYNRIGLDIPNPLDIYNNIINDEINNDE